MAVVTRITAAEYRRRLGRQRTLVVSPGGSDLGLAYRRATNATGVCPGCRVETTLVEPGEDGIGHVSHHHDRGCPVLDTVPKPEPVRRSKVGRNAPCPCGGRHKSKHHRQEDPT